VFTDTAFAGNPLAVITDGDGLSDSAMQTIAREMNLSETVFIQRPTEDRALARLRIFTTMSELPLAGHPVVGTWFLLAELGVVPAQEGSVHILQQTGAGVLPVEIEFHNGRPQRVTMTQKPAQFKNPKISKAALAQGLGLKLADFDKKLPIEAVSTGVFNLMVPLRNRKILDKIDLNVPVLRRALKDMGVVAYCFAAVGN
ncbi:MAG: PhzF family phenazine biosynthesis protein, partial [Acidobacteria bacterium]|nr:PhzF family phenazine biosynthesis protein [Acidobacteriota bacterium]